MSRSERALRSVADLRDAGFSVDGLEAVAQRYDIGVSPTMLGQIGTQGDAVGAQFIPSGRELEVRTDEVEDPIGDKAHSPVRGIVHRYPDRVLLKITNICAVYCRYCFRREMIGAGSDHLSPEDIGGAIDYIKAHPEIWEVILTGGDPFILSAGKLEKVILALNDVPHVKILRIHSRMPVADPLKINETIVSVLKKSIHAVQIVIHVNHVQEISDDARAAISLLNGANCSLFSQSVLLRGVNDDAQTLEILFRTLVALHVKPYYLHHLDRARGTGHFRVSLARGRQIMKDLQGRVSGLCLPHYMLDIPGGYGKIPIHEGYVRHEHDTCYVVEDYKGHMHMYDEGAGA